MKSKKKKSLTVIALIITLFAISFGLPKKEKNYIFKFFSPLISKSWQINNSISDFISGIIKNGSLKKENESLREENISLMEKNIALKKLEKEIRELKKIIDFNGKDEYEIIPAKVLFSLSENNCFLLNKGAKDGVENGETAIIGKGILVGAIKKSFLNFSEMCLSSKKGYKFPVTTIDSNNSLLAEGKGDGILVKFIPQNLKLKSQQIFVTSNLGKIFPAGLIVGKIKKIEYKANKEINSVLLKPPYEKIRLTEVFIIRIKPNEK